MRKLFTGIVHVLPFLLLGTLLSTELRGQSSADSIFTVRTCLCDDIEAVRSEGKDNISDNDVAIIINQIVDQLPFTDTERSQFKKELQVVAVTCATNARALPCPRFTAGSKSKQAGVIRYILYNDEFLNRLANNKRQKRPVSWSDYFILAHEVGHHYFNHTHKDTEGEPVSAGAKYNKKQLLPYLEKEKPNHINEFMADAAAVGVLFRMGATWGAVAFPFQQMIRKRIDLIATDKHPSSPSRLAQAERLWDAYAKNKLVFGAQQARNFADDFYDEDARKRFAIMQEHSFWTIQPGLEGFVGDPAFQVSKQPVSGVVNPGLGVIAQLSWKNWYSPHGADLALGASNQVFSTYTAVNGANRTVEKFNVFWATIQPTYSFHRIGWRGQRRDTAYHDRMGWFASIGGTIRVPLKATYINYATGENADSFTDLFTIVNPVVRVGFEKWTMHLPFGRHRNSYQVYLSYSPIRLRFRSDSDVDALIHQVGLGLLYGF